MPPPLPSLPLPLPRHAPQQPQLRPDSAPPLPPFCSSPLLCLQPPLITMIDSPPDSPSTPWRPGSTAYPPPALPTSAASGFSSSCLQLSKQELQKLYDELPEGSYDLSLRDIVEPPYSIHGNLDTPAASTEVEAELLPSSSNKAQPKPHQKQHHARSRSFRKSDSKYAPSSPKCKLAFSFSFPRGPPTGTLPTPRTPPARRHRTPSLLGEKPAQIGPPSASPPKPSFKRSSSINRSPSSKPNLHHHSGNRIEYNQRAAFSAAAASSRVHPSNQCSSCASYTIFFKSRCLVCGKLYCSNCAKDAMDSMSDGRRCKATCDTRLASKRFSRSLRSKCWSFCGNVDVTKNPRKWRSNF